MSGKKPVNPSLGKHLTKANRMAIEAGIRSGSTLREIGEAVGKDPTTVSKEIKRNRELTRPCAYPVDCLLYPKCQERKKTPVLCSKRCPSYICFQCRRRDHSPGACNGCVNAPACRYDKYQYRAGIAEEKYQETLVTSREGLNLTEEEGKELSAKVAPLIRKGQSPYVIITNHPELGISVGTLYNYISAGLMAPYGVTDSSLQMKTRRKPMKKKASLQYRKKQDKTYLIGRTYDDYNVFKTRPENEYRWVMEMDTVYNSVTDGPFMQTLLFVPCTFLMAFYQEERTDVAMVAGIDQLDELLGPELFTEAAGIILTDRGPEFVKADQFEIRKDGTRRAYIFYCDAMQSGQKGGVENDHLNLRKVTPKNSTKNKSIDIDYTDLRALGLTSQKALNEVLSNVNSFPRRSLDGRTPIEVMQFKKPELWEKLQSFGLRKVPPDDVVLKKEVLKAFRTGITKEDMEPETPNIIVNTVRPRFRKRNAIKKGES